MELVLCEGFLDRFFHGSISSKIIIYVHIGR